MAWALLSLLKNIREKIEQLIKLALIIRQTLWCQCTICLHATTLQKRIISISNALHENKNYLQVTKSINNLIKYYKVINIIKSK